MRLAGASKSHPAWDAWIEILAVKGYRQVRPVSHPAWDAWIEIQMTETPSKYIGSHPAWDAWIEIMGTAGVFSPVFSRIPHGMRGLKSYVM